MADEQPGHPVVEELSAFVDGALAGDARARIEAHLASCDACRAEVVATFDLLRRAPHHRVRWTLGLAAAAVLALLFVPTVRRAIRGEGLREPVVTTIAAPVAIGPQGPVAQIGPLVWSSAAYARRYRAVVLDSAGDVIWRTTTGDTVAAIPDSVALRAGSPYFWKVDAEIGFDRWVASDLVAFTVAAPMR